MSQAHLDALSKALTQRGWRVSELPVMENDGGGTWEIQRGLQGARIHIDFDRFNGWGDPQPIEESGFCWVRDATDLSLYFRQVKRSRDIWKKELADFVRALDRFSEAHET